MKQSAKALTFTGLAGAVAVAGASQAYGTVVAVQPPTNFTPIAPSTAGTTREYWNIDTGTTSTSNVAGTDINFGLYNNTTYNEFFTGMFVTGGPGTGAGTVSYYASNQTNYAYGLTAGKTVGTGGNYATFGQKAGFYTILSLVYAGTAYAIQKPNTTYYVGFKFTAADGLLHDGWLQLQSTYDFNTQTAGLNFLAAAWNNTPDAQGGRVIVGSYATPAAVPEPGTLAALAVGAAGLAGVGLKRRKAAMAAAKAA